MISDTSAIISLFLNENSFSSENYPDLKNFAVLNSISENYYKYLKSHIIYNETVFGDDGIMNDYTLFSNIENGIGIFAGCNPYTDTLIWNGQIITN